MTGKHMYISVLCAEEAGSTAIPSRVYKYIGTNLDFYTDKWIEIRVQNYNNIFKKKKNENVYYSTYSTKTLI